MAALTVRNIPDDVHRALKALAAQRGHSTEAEVRDILAAAVKPEGRFKMGQALAAIWGPVGLSPEEVAIMDTARDRTPAEPMSFD